MRRAVEPRFRFLVWYTHSSDTLRIYRVIHGARSTDEWPTDAETHG